MTQQIAVRLPDDLAAAVDRIVAERSTDRTSVVVAALRREVRRHQALRDVEILKASGPSPYPDLDGALRWGADHPVDVD
jgi:hypothetical protein